MPTEEIDSLVRHHSRKLQIEALQQLRGLHLVREKFQSRTVVLSARFRESFKSALTAGDANNSFGVPCDTEDKYRVDVAFLDRHATEKWENILHFMVGTPTENPPGEGVLQLLVQSGMMEGRSSADLSITNAGFQFLLQDVNAQIWTLLLQYLNMSASLRMDPVDVLNFIFMLGSLELGRDYSLTALSSTQVQMLEDLRDFGIVYQRKASSRRFYPTRLATTLTSEASVGLRSASAAMSVASETGDTTTPAKAGSGLIDGSNTGFIILETNYKLYAYTDSPLQIAVLNLFCHLKNRFPNMVTAQITRDSVRRALSNGILADQIITYLTVHAHRQMRRSDTGSVLPTTVVDQIKLWQLEMDRVRATEGYLYTEFRDQKEYETIVGYAEELGVLVWKSAARRKFFVTKEGNAQVIDFVNRRMRS